MLDRSLLIVVLFAGFIVTSIIDWIAVAAWWSWYFRNGLCIYRKTVQVPNSRYIQVLTETLTERFASRHWRSTQYGALGPGEWAMRRAGPWWDPGFHVVIMHGRLLVDPANGRVTVLGYADWATIWSAVVLVGGVIVIQQLVVIALALLVAVGLLVNYASRASLYEEVSQYAAYRLANPIVE
jgi:hypothetical protein